MKKQIVAGGLASAAFLAAMTLIGCTEHPTLIPSSDPQLNKPSTELAADAARRFPYKADAAKGGLVKARAQVSYITHVLELMNLTDEEWTDVEVWVNQEYVVFLPKWKGMKSVSFNALFDGSGHSFPTSKAQITKVEILRDGKMCSVTGPQVTE